MVLDLICLISTLMVVFVTGVAGNYIATAGWVGCSVWIILYMLKK